MGFLRRCWFQNYLRVKYFRHLHWLRIDNPEYAKVHLNVWHGNQKTRLGWFTAYLVNVFLTNFYFLRVSSPLLLCPNYKLTLISKLVSFSQAEKHSFVTSILSLKIRLQNTTGLHPFKGPLYKRAMRNPKNEQ